MNGQPIVVVSATTEYRVRRDQANVAEDLIALLDSLAAPVYLVFDVTNLHFDLADILAASNESTRGAQAFLHHPRVREVVVITTNSALQLAVRGMRSDVFGNVRISAFSAMNEAMVHLESARQG
jgi:hypothetical protein